MYRDVGKNDDLMKPGKESTRLLLLGSLQDSGGDTPKDRKGPRPIVFEMVKHIVNDELHITPQGLSNVTVDIRPEDLKKALEIDCFRDICQTVVGVPVKIKAEVPLLFVLVRLTYQRKFSDGGQGIEQIASIQGQYTPIKFNTILNASLEFGADLKKSPGKWVEVTKVNCKGSLSCDLPIASFAAQADQHGLTFRASGQSPVFHGDFVKLSQEPPSFEGVVKYADLPNAIMRVVKGLTNIKSVVRPGPLDVLWQEFGDLRGPM
jgi:hypothetical protein